MKMNFNRAALTEALGLLTSVVPSRTPKPILRCVRITAGEKGVCIDATDLEVGIKYTISEVQVEKPGEAVIQADRLAAIVRESSDEVLVLEETEGKYEITGSDSHFTIYGQEPSQYPQIPEFEGKPDIEMALENLQAGVAKCIFATAKESSRYAINGILWEIKGKKLLLVATDGRRLARCKVNLASAPVESKANVKVIIPVKAMSLLEKITPQDKEKLAVKLNDNHVIFSYGNIIMSSSLVEGSFPKYEDIIPVDYDKKLMLSTEAVLSAVRRAALLTSEESRGIKLSISKDSLIFSSRSPETGAAEINMVADYKGEPIDVGFNPQFLIDALRVMQTSEFEMELSQPDKPGLIKSGADFLYVLMPISLG
jgi:DNA polymerase-3 subunit beta